MGKDKAHNVSRPKFTGGRRTAQAEIRHKIQAALRSALRRELTPSGKNDYVHGTLKPKFTGRRRGARAQVRCKIEKALRNALTSQKCQQQYGCAVPSARQRGLPMPKVTVQTPEAQELIDHLLNTFTFPTEGNEQYKLENATTKCHLTGVELKVNEISFEHLVDVALGGQADKDNWVIIAKPLNSLQQFRKHADPTTWERLKEPIRKFLDLETHPCLPESK